MNLKPYRFTGKQDTHLGRHGVIKPNEVIWLDKSEQDYLATNPNPQIVAVSEEEAAKLTAPKLSPDGDSSASEEEEGKQSTGTEALAYQTKELEESLVEEYSAKELREMCKDRELTFKQTDGKPALAKMLAPLIAAEQKSQSE